MDVQITVSGPDGRQIANVWHLKGQGDLTRAVGEALDLYHQTYPNSPLFEHAIKVEHA